MDTSKFQCPAEKGSSRKLGFRYTGRTLLGNWASGTDYSRKPRGMKGAGAVRDPGPHIPYRSSERALGREHLTTEGLSTGGCVTRFTRNPHRLYPLFPRQQRRGLVVGKRSSRCDCHGDSRLPHVVGRLQEHNCVIVPKGQEGFVDGNPELLVGW